MLSKLQPFLSKQSLKTQKKLKELEIMYCKLLISSEKMLVSAELKGYTNHGHNILILFDCRGNFPFTASETKRDY